jgi:hypothetical protein
MAWYDWPATILTGGTIAPAFQTSGQNSAEQRAAGNDQLQIGKEFQGAFDAELAAAGIPATSRAQLGGQVGEAARAAYAAAIKNGMSPAEARNRAQAAADAVAKTIREQNRMPQPNDPTATQPTAETQNVRALRDKLLSERDKPQPGAPNVQGVRADTTRPDQFRGTQLQTIEQLRGLANGTGPSVAQEQLRKANLGIEQSTIGMAAGGDAGSRRMATRTMSDQKRGAAIDSALLRANEQIGAIGQMGAVAGQGRGQDESVADANANRSMDANKTNAANSLTNRDIGVRERQGLGELGLQAQGQETQTALVQAQINQIKANIESDKERLRLARTQEERAAAQQSYDNNIKLLAAVMGGLGSIGSMAK